MASGKHAPVSEHRVLQTGFRLTTLAQFAGLHCQHQHALAWIRRFDAVDYTTAMQCPHRRVGDDDEAARVRPVVQAADEQLRFGGTHKSGPSERLFA